MKKLILFAVIITGLSLSFVACGKKGGDNKDSLQSNNNNNNETNTINGKAAVCLFDKMSLLTQASRKEGKWVTSLALGEKVTYLGDEKKDETGKYSFVKVKTSGNQEGYVDARIVIPNSEVACITEQTPLYSRPELTTVTKNNFEPFDVIAITNTQGDWLEVVGKRRKSTWIDKGWIKSKMMSKSDKDIAVAVYCVRALAQNTPEKSLAELKKIQGNNDLKGSIFDEDIQAIVDKLSGNDNAKFHEEVSVEDGNL